MRNKRKNRRKGEREDRREEDLTCLTNKQVHTGIPEAMSERKSFTVMIFIKGRDCKLR